MSMTNEEASNILRLLAAESLEGVSRFIESEKNRDLYKRAYEMAIKSLEESVSVVRCKDCKFSIPINDDEDGYRCTFHERYYDNEKRMLWHSGCFCSFGERRSE